jgi:hypothetical protein
VECWGDGWREENKEQNFKGHIVRILGTLEITTTTVSIIL